MKRNRREALKVSRRDALKLGGVAAVGGAALAVVPIGKGAQTQAPSRLSGANFPKPYTVEITKTPAAVPTMIDGVAHYDFTMKRNPAGQVLTGDLKTPVFGYEGVFPGPRIELNKGTPAVVRHHNALPAVGPFGQPHHDLRAPARLGLAARVRRLRQRHHRPGTVQGLPLPELPAGPDAVVPRPRRALDRPAGLRRPGRAVPAARQGGVRAAADRGLRHPPGDQRRDVRRRRLPGL